MTTSAYSPDGPATRGSANRSVRWRGLGLQVILLVGLLGMLYPLLWMISASFKPESQIFGNVGLWPTTWVWTNYANGWNGAGASFGTYFLNSFILAGLAVVGNVASCTLAAYAFARLRFRFQTIWFGIMLATMMIPYQVLAVPQYIVFRQLGWINTFLPLVVPRFFAVDGFFIFLIAQFIRGIPRDLDMAAAIDGCGPFRVFRYVILPLTTPAMVTAAIFSFMWTWDDFFGQLIYLSNFQQYTIPLGLSALQASTYGSTWGQLMAMSVLSLIPVTVFFLIFQRRLVEGLATTGLRG
jgi:multiple sugar transport system permease protein